MNNRSSIFKKIRLKKYFVALSSMIHYESCQAFNVKSYLSLGFYQECTRGCTFFPGKSHKLEPGSDNNNNNNHNNNNKFISPNVAGDLLLMITLCLCACVVGSASVCLSVRCE